MTNLHGCLGGMTEALFTEDKCPECGRALRYPNRRGKVTCPTCQHRFDHYPKTINGLPSLTVSLVRNGMNSTALQLAKQSANNIEGLPAFSIERYINWSKVALWLSVSTGLIGAATISLHAIQELDFRPTDNVIFEAERELGQAWKVERKLYSNTLEGESQQDAHLIPGLSLSLHEGSILFPHNSATITAEGREKLDSFARSATSRFTVYAAGHTDSNGSSAFNLSLSKRRAEATRAYLSHRLPKESAVFAIGFGESRPVASNETARGRAENRRVELMVVVEKRRTDFLDFLGNLPDWVNGAAAVATLVAFISSQLYGLMGALKKRVTKRRMEG